MKGHETMKMILKNKEKLTWPEEKIKREGYCERAKAIEAMIIGICTAIRIHSGSESIFMTKT